MTTYLLSYDVSEDRLRNKLAKLLLRKGCQRLQKSVFLAPNFSLKELNSLQRAVHDLGATAFLPTDSLICLPIEKPSLPILVWQGNTTDLQHILQEVLFILK